jgi:multisubunit Na+/H+ antiporter MnhG subunit
MEKRELIIATIGVIFIIIGLIILAIVPDVSTRFFVGGLITWLGVILLARALFKR